MTSCMLSCHVWSVCDDLLHSLLQPQSGSLHAFRFSVTVLLAASLE
jgi:hypothetical protein